MKHPPEIEVVRVDFGAYPSASRLNHKIPKDSPLLHATLDIRWDVRDPAVAVQRFEWALADFSPSFKSHECRGPEAYHVVPGAGEDGSGAGAAPQPFDAGLALAHLIEHVMIDFACAMTDQKRCSGITAAHRTIPGRYDLLVESPDREVGACCLGLALSVVASAVANGSVPGEAERDILRAGRLAYARRGLSLLAPELSRALGWTEARAEKALRALKDVGYLSELSYTVNFSGVSDFRVSSC